MEVITGVSARLERERDGTKEYMCAAQSVEPVRRRQMCLGFENVDKKNVYEKK